MPVNLVRINTDSTGQIIEILCEYVPSSRSGNDTSGIKTKGTLHWVSEAESISAELRIYDRLFTVEEPLAEKNNDFRELINPDSRKIETIARLEPSLKDVKPLDKYQFERKGYFCVDKDSNSGKLIFNQTVTLRDSYSKKLKKGS